MTRQETKNSKRDRLAKQGRKRLSAATRKRKQIIPKRERNILARFKELGVDYPQKVLREYGLEWGEKTLHILDYKQAANPGTNFTNLARYFVANPNKVGFSRLERDGRGPGDDSDDDLEKPESGAWADGGAWNIQDQIELMKEKEDMSRWEREQEMLEQAYKDGDEKVMRQHGEMTMGAFRLNPHLGGLFL